MYALDYHGHGDRGGIMAITALLRAREETGHRVWKPKVEARGGGGGSFRPTIPTTTREPYTGARHDRADRVVQLVLVTEKALLVFDFTTMSSTWIPRWLWPSNAVVTMPGDAGPVALPLYLLRQWRVMPGALWPPQDDEAARGDGRKVFGPQKANRWERALMRGAARQETPS